MESIRIIFLLSYELQGENPKFVLPTTKFVTFHARENLLQLSREEKDRNIFFHLKVNICLYVDTIEGWNHITWIVDLHCFDSATFRTRERYRILDSNSIQPGFNYQHVWKHTLQLPFLEVGYLFVMLIYSWMCPFSKCFAFFFHDGKEIKLHHMYFLFKCTIGRIHFMFIMLFYGNIDHCCVLI